MDAAETVETAGPVLDGIPRQPGGVPGGASVAAPGGASGGASRGVTERGPAEVADVGAYVKPGAYAAPGAHVEPEAHAGRVSSLRRRAPFPRPWRLLPTPVGTPFTFLYATVLVVTSLVAEYADPALVHALHQGSSTDVAHLVRTPVLVLLASALWVAGGVASLYAVAFLLVLTALERRIGGWRTAGVFLSGHVLATLATEVPVGFAVLAGHLPDSSLHRLDYGISFGVAASAGALAGLLPPWPRRLLLLGFGGMLVDDLLAYADPMTNWGHLLSLAIGVAAWPVVRRWRHQRRGSGGAGELRAGQWGPHRPAQ
ncbi:MULTISPECIES: rhomboid-like protein [Streptomyces]|uniref:rhomboid-like protein n=1 Tax=Streptomyces TaxID=1883 RepID=UPI001EF09BA2|nr:MULTISPECIES: rhomboid-like protein [unclassified Streptomyces]